MWQPKWVSPFFLVIDFRIKEEFDIEHDFKFSSSCHNIYLHGHGTNSYFLVKQKKIENLSFQNKNSCTDTFRYRIHSTYVQEKKIIVIYLLLFTTPLQLRLFNAWWNLHIHMQRFNRKRLSLDQFVFYLPLKTTT